MQRVTESDNRTARPAARDRGRRWGLVFRPGVLLAGLILAYTIFFSAYTLQRHAAFRTFAADLSYIDQPMWNTLHGRFLERTLDDRQVSRVAEHLEPIIVPLALVYLLWNDVRAILILQTVALALGGLPIYWIARRALGGDRRAEWLALVFALVYLMFPALQAANVADFHADPFIVTPLLLAFWHASRRRYGPMWIWAGVAMLVKENLPALTFMLGGYVALAAVGETDDRPQPKSADRSIAVHSRRSAVIRRLSFWHGVALMVVSLAWFYIATFAIVAPLARQVYGAPGPIYLAHRFTDLTGGLDDLTRNLWETLRQPARLDYLAGLFSSVGWLALLAPEFLFLGLPVLAANTLSNFPGQFSGEQHYSAPLAPVFVIAAVYGARRIMWLGERLAAASAPAGAAQRDRPRASLHGGAIVLGVWLLIWSVGYHVQAGWTPLARDFEWPQRTSHHALLDRFMAQIPADAAVSATAALHPHLAHRTKIYVFPTIADADYVLLDVSGVTDMHPNDVRAQVERLPGAGEFGVEDAADGYILLSRRACPERRRRAAGIGRTQALPDAFYDFARAGGRQPAYRLDVQFGDRLRLLGYDLMDDPKWRLTRFRFYWQVAAALPADATISVQVLTPTGEAADDTAQRPMPALLWYPPAAWQPGEVVVAESVPWYLPAEWAPVIRVTMAGQTVAASASGSPGESGPEDDRAYTTTERLPYGRLRLPIFARRGGRLSLADFGDRPGPAAAAFESADWAIELGGHLFPERVAPGGRLAMRFFWQGRHGQTLQPAPRDYTLFLHLRNADGRTAAQGDAMPTWFVPRPTSQWQPAGDRPARGLWAGHAIALPADLPPGGYAVVIGWYFGQTGERLAWVDETKIGRAHV